MNKTYDVIIVGGSFSGLSAALQLVRARKNILIIDAGSPRNIKAHESHGFLTQDGTPPSEILKISREQILKYPTADLINDKVLKAEKINDSLFKINTAEKEYSSKRIILASGVKDNLPEIEGLDTVWGTSSFFCPYCHAYEFQDQNFSLISNDPRSYHQAMILTEWTNKINWFTESELDSSQLENLSKKGVNIIRTKVVKINSKDGLVTDVVDSSGKSIPTQAIVLAPFNMSVSPLVGVLGCEVNEMGMIKVSEKMETSVKGIFAAGDHIHMMHNVAGAVGNGAIAGAMAHQSLIFEN